MKIKSSIKDTNKIILFIILLSIAFQSCKYLIFLTKDARDIIKIYGATKTTHKQNCMKFIYKNGSIYLPIIIDNKSDTVLFDTGNNSYLNYLEYNDTIPPNTKVMSVSAVNSKTKLHYTYKTVNIENDLFTSCDYMQMTLFIPYPKSMCTNHTNMSKKIIGINFLPKNQYIFKINFSDSSLCINNSNTIDTTGYKRIKSSFEKNSVVYIYVTIDGIEYKFLFDTGSGLTLGINKKYYKNHKNRNDLVLEGYFGKGVNGIISGKSIIKQDKQAVYLTNSDSIYIKHLLFLEKLARNNMGMGFISTFDWMFDFSNKTVYVKPLTTLNQNDTNKKHFTYLVAEHKNKLIIVTRNLSAKPTIPLNSVIKSVNGTKITSENICYYLDFLNNNPDWSNFQIEFDK